MKRNLGVLKFMLRIRLILICLILILSIVFLGSGCKPKLDKQLSGKELKWQALHIRLYYYSNDQKLEKLAQYVPKLSEMGINTIIIDVGYHFPFTSHPELRKGDNTITKNGARNFAKICQENNIRLIPQFQCVGHQSWKRKTSPLLTEYPELDLTPGAFPWNIGLYCREWDVLNPKVYDIVFELIDEIIDAFEAEYFHVGMDEIFLLGSDKSPSTRERNPAELFAKAVNDIYNHIVKKRGLQMLMWGDRLIDGNVYVMYSKWEASKNGTSPAVDMIPKDIIICDWHYELEETYPSIPMFIEKGFRVLPTSYNNIYATDKLLRYSVSLGNPNMLGHLFTTWSDRSARENLIGYEPMVHGLEITVKNR